MTCMKLHSNGFSFQITVTVTIKKNPTYINSVKLPFILLKISDSHAYL